MSTVMINSAERLRVLRERLENISQTDSARILGLPRHKIADIEFGRATMVMIDTWEAERINIRTGQIYMVTMPDGGSAFCLALARRKER